MRRITIAAMSALGLAFLAGCTGGPSAEEIEEQSAEWAATLEPYALTYELVDAEAAAEAVAQGGSIYVAAPLFAFDQKVIELSPALEPRAIVELTDSHVLGIAQDGDTLRALDADCLAPTSGYAFCSNLATITADGMELDAATADDELDFHGLEFDADGQGYWALRYAEVACDDSVYPCGLGTEEEPLELIYDCEVVHYRDGEVEWEWSALEHLPNAMLDQGSQTGVYTADDPYHCNSVQVDQDAGVSYVSMRHVNAGVTIDLETNEVLWTFGAYDGPEALAIEDPEGLLGDRQTLSGNHDFRWLGDNRYSIFDNGSAEVGPARVVVFSVEDGTATIETVLEDPAGVSSGCTGSARPIGDDEAFWAVSWGCSASGVSVLTAEGDTVATITVDTEKALAEGMISSPADTVPFLTPAVSYLAVVGDQGLLD